MILDHSFNLSLKMLVCKEHLLILQLHDPGLCTQEPRFEKPSQQFTWQEFFKLLPCAEYRAGSGVSRVEGLLADGLSLPIQVLFF